MDRYFIKKPHAQKKYFLGKIFRNTLKKILRVTIVNNHCIHDSHLLYSIGLSFCQNQRESNPQFRSFKPKFDLKKKKKKKRKKTYDQVQPTNQSLME